jgi:tocopherol O-methyltransferase
VLDVGCGIGGTSRHLALAHTCTVTGITISPKQVEIATRLTGEAAAVSASSDVNALKATAPSDTFTQLGDGKVRFLELDAEKMAGAFADREGTFDVVWISEALSHFPNKALFFQNAHKVLKDGGKLVLADWFKDEGLDETTFNNDIKPIEGSFIRKFWCPDSPSQQSSSLVGEY